MKKTQKTMATALLLSSAVAMQSQLSKSAVYNDASAQALYGPPSVLIDKGDANWDGDINILDMITLKNKVLNGTEYTSFDGAIYDINSDETINSEDLLLLQYYFTGITTYIGVYECQPTYGPVSAVPEAEITEMPVEYPEEYTDP